MTFRDLRADEIDVRLQSVKQNGLMLLLYIAMNKKGAKIAYSVNMVQIIGNVTLKRLT